MGQHNQKFLSSQSGTDVGLACMRRQNSCEGLKHVVARIVSMGVVDLIEEIQVRHHYPKRKDLEVLKPVFERMRTEGADFFQKNSALAEEVRRTFVDLDEVEKELKKAAKAIDKSTACPT
jgi:hypothetical protein